MQDIEFIRDQWNRVLLKDNLYSNLSTAERTHILSDDILSLDQQKLYSIVDTLDILNASPWMTTTVSNPSIRYWFNKYKEYGLEEYVNPERSGNRRTFQVESILRLKLIFYWHFIKEFTLQQVSDQIYGVERQAMIDWSPNMEIDTDNISIYRVSPEHNGAFVTAIINKMQKNFFKVAEEIRGTLKQELKEEVSGEVQEQLKNLSNIQKSLGFPHASKQTKEIATALQSGQETLATEHDETRLIALEAKFREELRDEAASLWAKNPVYNRQMLGLVKTVDERAKETFIQEYINTHLTKRMEEYKRQHIEPLKEKLRFNVDEILGSNEVSEELDTRFSGRQMIELGMVEEDQEEE